MLTPEELDNKHLASRMGLHELLNLDFIPVDDEFDGIPRILHKENIVYLFTGINDGEAYYNCPVKVD